MEMSMHSQLSLSLARRPNATALTVVIVDLYHAIRTYSWENVHASTYHNQVAELQVTGERSSLARDTLHETAVTGEHFRRAPHVSRLDTPGARQTHRRCSC